MDCALHTCGVSVLLTDNKSMGVLGIDEEDITQAGVEIQRRMAMTMEMKWHPMNLWTIASNKFKSLKQTGKWEAPDENEEKLIAPQTKIKKLKQKAQNIQERPGKRKGDKDGTKTPGSDWLENHVKPKQSKDTK